jgi:hypothetical protein
MKSKTIKIIMIVVAAATATSFAIAQLFIPGKSDLTNAMSGMTNEVIGRVKEEVIIASSFGDRKRAVEALNNLSKIYEIQSGEIAKNNKLSKSIQLSTEAKKLSDNLKQLSTRVGKEQQPIPGRDDIELPTRTNDPQISKPNNQNVSIGEIFEGEKSKVYGNLSKQSQNYLDRKKDELYDTRISTEKGKDIKILQDLAAFYEKQSFLLGASGKFSLSEESKSISKKLSDLAVKAKS